MTYAVSSCSHRNGENKRPVSNLLGFEELAVLTRLKLSPHSVLLPAPRVRIYQL
jgi:hypothetical protein